MEILVITVVALGLILSLAVSIIERDDDSVIIAIWKFFSYYTTLTNLLVLIWIVILFVGRGAIYQFAINANVGASITFYIFTVGLANYLIFGVPSGRWFSLVSDTLVHAIVPMLTLIYWLEVFPKQGIYFTYLPFWLIYPLAYALYTLLHSHWSRFYPYPFTNTEVLGRSKVIFNVIGLSLSVLVGGFVFIVLGKWLS